jgi:hypothetical protein
MPNRNSVLWIDRPKAIAGIIENAITKNSMVLENAQNGSKLSINILHMVETYLVN